MSQLRVFKFGGTSIGSADAVRRAVALIEQHAPNLVVVISAASGTTDLLLNAAADALRGDATAAAGAATEFRARHLELIDELVSRDDLRLRLVEEVQRTSHELRSMCESIAILRELTTRTRDAVVARGERVMARIVEACVEAKGLAAVYVDATEVIFLEGRSSDLWPDFHRTAAAAKGRLLPIAAAGVAIVPGYIASGSQGEVVTLGRGGSDFSAAILARALDAASLTLWKEVDGLMTADPRAVAEARVLPELHYREAAELAFYGAKVLHPRTMIPLLEKKIPLHLKNTFRPELPGTRIAGDVAPGAYPVKALTAIPEQTLVAIEGSGMIGVPGIAARAFGALAQAGHSVSMISQASSESSICFVVPTTEADECAEALREAFERELRRNLIDDIRVSPGVALLAVVGLGMRGTPGIAARSFTALSREGINVVAIAQGSSELNITIAIEESAVPRALHALHREFQLSKIRPLGITRAREAGVSLLGFGRIGRTLVEQMIGQEQFLSDELGVRLHCTAVVDRSGVVLEEHGFPAIRLRTMLERKAAGQRLLENEPGEGGDIRKMLVEQLWVLPSSRPVLVDVTADETAPIILEALRHGSHVVLANKKPLAVSQAEYDELFATARAGGLQLRYEATVGAGLPVLDTFAKLREAGDEVQTVVGCLSGTLGYLMTQLEDGMKFSEAVRKAYALGYTEPDPRDDLSGVDVGRKALILARTLGLRLDLRDIAIESLFPESMRNGDVEWFLKEIEKLDAEFEAKTETGRARDEVLRYVARIDPNGVSVGLRAVRRDSPMGRLRGTDNQIVIHSRRYSTNPLVVIGPGAGAEVTAAGVLNDIVAIATAEERPRAPEPSR